MKINPWFKPHEFACKCGCGLSEVSDELIDVLVDVREHYNAPVKINSGRRCVEHNRKEGGASNSKHLTGEAADIVVKGVNAEDVADYLESKYPDKYGIGRYNGRTHIDVRKQKARWKK